MLIFLSFIPSKIHVITFLPFKSKLIGTTSCKYHRCKSLSSITLPESVTSVGYYCFGFSGLTSITLSNNLTSLVTIRNKPTFT